MADPGDARQQAAANAAEKLRKALMFVPGEERHDAAREALSDLARSFDEANAEVGLLLVRVQEEREHVEECKQIAFEYQEGVVALSVRVQEAERALRDAADTFKDFALGLRLIGHETMAEAALIAEQATRAVLGGDVQEQETTTDSGDDGNRRQSGGKP